MSVYAKGGYLDQKTRSPLSLGAAIAVNGAVVGALLLANPDVIPEQIKIFRTITVPSDPPPPEPSPPPQERRADTRPPAERVVASESPVRPDDTSFVTIKLPEQPPMGRTDLGGGGGGTIVPPREPVFVGAQINPRFRDQLQPPYPPGKIRADQEGVVEVRVLIGIDGRVKQVQKISATDDAFFRVTEEQALRRWRFLPATRDGVPEESWQVKTVRFRLDQL